MVGEGRLVTTLSHILIKPNGRVYGSNGYLTMSAPFPKIADHDVLVPAEPFLKELDTAASSVIKSVVDRQILPSSDFDRYILAAFAAAQFLRVEDMRNGIRSQQAQISEWLTSLGVDPRDVKGFDVLSADEIRTASILHLGDLKDYVPGFLKKLWILLRTTDAMPFYISDTPVTLRNERDFGALSGLGLEVPGIEIHLPLSKTLTLGLLCSSHFPLFQSAGREEHVLSGVPLDVPDRMVLSLNELQVMFSSRFVYSCNGDFELVKDVVSQRPHLRKGMRRKGLSQPESGHVRK